ncbi:Dna2/Cas4 domain-containing protein [Methanobrevibacter sp. DSM 116169]|uniref:CRISPR-associated protein Cas4 n=1 Tax=Methanobrevibacter sp. DSM 116169 TaxID=3242727 RepID=UPI0038FC1BF2
MINISSIKQFMYCPLKLYYQYQLDEKEDNDLLLHGEIKRLRVDINDLTQKNIRKIKAKMELNEIESILIENIISYIDMTISNLEKSLPEEYSEKIEEQKIEIISEVYFSIKILALKTSKAMETLDKNGNQIVEMFFPNSMQAYVLKDPDLEIIGSCDKIEIIDGKYYPVQLRTSKPPIKGVWDSDAVELAANALLIEQEFDTEVFVGFIEYIQIKERRPVVMDVHLRKSLFKILKEIKMIKKDEIIPKTETIRNKCLNCNYNDICKAVAKNK